MGEIKVKLYLNKSVDTQKFVGRNKDYKVNTHPIPPHCN